MVYCATLFNQQSDLMISRKRPSKKTKEFPPKSKDRSTSGQTWKLFSVYLLLMECKMITYTKSPMHSLGKWWLWSGPKFWSRIEGHHWRDCNANTFVFNSKYFLGLPCFGKSSWMQYNHLFFGSFMHTGANILYLSKNSHFKNLNFYKFTF